MTKPNEREAIFNLQRYLRQLSYHDTAIPSPPLDGVMDTVTTDALKAFQKSMRYVMACRPHRQAFD